MAGVILGDWTHRRADAGGTRALSADVLRASPTIAWSWRPEHGGPVDQVRIAGTRVYVATLAPRDDLAPGWEHAVVYSLDAQTGHVIAKRTLPDPVPVAAMMIDDGVVHIVATRKGEPIYWYALAAEDLTPKHRRAVELDRDARNDDVLDAWSVPGGGIWLELEGTIGESRGRAFAFVSESGSAVVTQTHEEDIAAADWGSPARDACAGGHTLFAPLAAPALWKVEPKITSGGGQHDRALTPPAQTVWARTDVAGTHTRLHAMSADGIVACIAAAEDPEREGRALVQAFARDRSSDIERWKTNVARVPVRGSLGEGARLVRRPNGELLFQSIRGDGTACSDLVCARPDAPIESLPLGKASKYVLDAALGDLVLAHHEGKKGRVVVAGFEIDRKGRLLGRRSALKWTVETADLGGSATVYAGAGHIVVRGERGVAAVRV